MRVVYGKITNDQTPIICYSADAIVAAERVKSSINPFAEPLKLLHGPSAPLPSPRITVRAQSGVPIVQSGRRGLPQHSVRERVVHPLRALRHFFFFFFNSHHNDAQVC